MDADITKNLTMIYMFFFKYWELIIWEQDKIFQSPALSII